MNRPTLAADAAAAADALTQVATHAAEEAVRSTVRLGDSAALLARQGGDAALHAADAVRAQALQWERSTRRYIEQQPLKAALIAMAAGAALVLVGSLLLRDRRGPR